MANNLRKVRCSVGFQAFLGRKNSVQNALKCAKVRQRKNSKNIVTA